MDNAKLKHIFYEILNRFELYIGCVLFLIMMVLLTIQVISRYAGHPQAGTGNRTQTCPASEPCSCAWW